MAGEYNLDNAQATLLMMAKNQAAVATDSAAEEGPAQDSLAYAAIGGTGTCLLALAVVARRQYAVYSRRASEMPEMEMGAALPALPSGSMATDAL